MVMINWKKWILVFLALLPAITFAAPVPSWQIVPDISTLTFTASQMGVPVTGEFNKFSGDIYFDPSQLNASSVKIIVDVAHIVDPNNRLNNVLPEADWLNARVFPQAIFNSNDFIKIGDNTYDAVGTLTLRDKTLPVTLTFTVDESSSSKAHVEGSTIIKRTAFGVGQGQWADTKSIPDDVIIKFDITATKS